MLGSLFHRSRTYLLDQIDSTRATRLLHWIFLGAMLILTAWLIYFAFVTISMPYQIEYREGAAQLLTQVLLRGGNPFSSAYQPLAFNNYGIVYNLVAFPFAAWFGNTLAVYRSINLLFILFSCALVAFTIIQVYGDRYFGFASGVFVGMALLSRGGLGAFPGALGEFLFLAAVLIPLLRRFDPSALILSAVLSVILYYTKPYFVLSFGIVATYVFVFVSKRKGLLYSFSFGVLFVLSYLFVRYYLKYYFIDTFIGNESNTKSSVAILTVQLVEWLREFYPAIVLGLLVLVLSAAAAWRPSALPRIDLRALDQPLVASSVSYFAFFFLVCFLAFCLILGQYSGGILTYLFQIVVIPFFLWLLQALQPRTRLALLAPGVLLFNMILFGLIWFQPALLEQKDSMAWARLFQYVDQSKNILNSPVIASEMVRIGLQPVDSGQTEYFYHVKPYPDDKLIGPNYDEVKAAGKQFKDSIHNSVTRGNYDAIIISEGENFFVPSDIAQYYVRVDSLTVLMPQSSEQWNLEVWKPTVAGVP